MNKLISEADATWKRQWASQLPSADELKYVYPERWVRFHFLPNSKRMPKSDEEYSIVLDRYNRILSDLQPGEMIYVITTQWSGLPDDSDKVINPEDPAAKFWLTIFETPEESDPDFWCYRYVYISKKPWSIGVVDGLLRSIADDESFGVILAPLDMRWLFHPYDGGMDVICETVKQKNRLRAAYSDWLSSHPEGL